MSIDGDNYSVRVETVENGFIVYYSRNYTDNQKIFTNVEDMLDFVRETVYPKYLEERHPGLRGRAEEKR
jgi:phage pi2 protein 07